MADSESTEWTTVSMPKEAAEDVRAVYKQRRDDVYLNQPEPLWAFVLRAVAGLDDEESDE